MKFLIPEPDIILYQDGFNDSDLLGRAAFGKKLSELLERIDDPLVVALDGNWGAGKSYFLRSWVGAHVKQNDGIARTIYFDAFSNDFLDEPLISLTSAISSRFPAEENEPTGILRMKKAVSKFGAPIVRIAAAVATAGIAEYTGAIVDAALNATSDELTKQSEAFWKREDGKRAAMDDFRQALLELVGETASSEKGGKLIFVVDELDRCRPDFALSLLETIKHFFSVPNVHLVLEVNLRELENMIRTRYGHNVNANAYLQKFISISTQLPNNHLVGSELKTNGLSYLSSIAETMKIDSELISAVSIHIEMIECDAAISIRSIQKILSFMTLVPMPENGSYRNYYLGWQLLIAGLLVLKVLVPDVYKKVVDRRIDMEDIRIAFGFPYLSLDQSLRRNADLVDTAWRSCLARDSLSVEQKAHVLWQYGEGSLDLPSRIARDYVEFVRLGA